MMSLNFRFKPYKLIVAIFISTFIVTSISCKKEKQQNAACQLNTITRTTNGLVTYSYAYNQDGTVKTIKQSDIPGQSSSFTYKPNTMLIQVSSDPGNAFSSLDSLTLNNAGYMINWKYFLKADRSLWLNGKYELNASNEIIKYQETNSGGPSINEDVYKYINGNIAQINDIKYTYDAAKPAMLGDHFSLSLLLNYGLKYNLNKNLATSEISGSDTTYYKYTYDSEGRISVYDAVYHGNVITRFKYNYMCN